MNSAADSPRLFPAKSMSPQRRKHTALEAATNRKTISYLANENNTSRKFIRKQRDKALTAVDESFNLAKTDNEVIFYLPVTNEWIQQLVLSLMLAPHASYRNIITLLKDCFDMDISLGKVHAIFTEAVEMSMQLNASEDLSKIKISSNDELFHHNRPVLSGIDIRSLYCYLLSYELQRDEETWAINLLDAKDKGMNPERMISDDAGGLISGHQLVFPKTPCDYDNFHLLKGLMDLRRYFRNRLKSSMTALSKCEIQLRKNPDNKEWHDNTSLSCQEKERMQYLSSTIDTLISWLAHDVLNKAGPSPIERRKLYDFIVDEFKKLESMESHRIKEMRTLLENKRVTALAFSDALNERFMEMSMQWNIPVDLLWEMCRLQRYDYEGSQYAIRSLSLQEKLSDQFDEIEDAVMIALDTTESTSSMIENLNGRVRKHIYNRQEIGHGYLDLLRFFLNHSPILRSARTERQGKTPAEILTGKPHPHWLEMLGFDRFKRAA